TLLKTKLYDMRQQRLDSSRAAERKSKVGSGDQGVGMSLLSALALVATLAWPPGVGPDPVGVWPLQPEPEVIRPFEPPDSPYGPGHRGVDLLGAAGQAVLTALPGTVTYAGSLAGRG
ncbi:MAG TPA: hypothetical protein PL137_17850, partial [Nocardioides sp.]|nr:hypothetical protein [Nocardioides sp.]